MTVRFPTVVEPPPSPITTGTQVLALVVADSAVSPQNGSPTTSSWYWANWAAVMASQVAPGTTVTVYPSDSSAYCSRLIGPEPSVTPSSVVTESASISAVIAT